MAVWPFVSTGMLTPSSSSFPSWSSPKAEGLLMCCCSPSAGICPINNAADNPCDGVPYALMLVPSGAVPEMGQSPKSSQVLDNPNAVASPPPIVIPNPASIGSMAWPSAAVRLSSTTSLIVVERAVSSRTSTASSDPSPGSSRSTCRLFVIALTTRSVASTGTSSSSVCG